MGKLTTATMKASSWRPYPIRVKYTLQNTVSTCDLPQEKNEWTEDLVNTTAVVPGELRAGAPKDSGLEVVSLVKRDTQWGRYPLKVWPGQKKEVTEVKSPKAQNTMQESEKQPNTKPTNIPKAIIY